jgi:hypothetical protein
VYVRLAAAWSDPAGMVHHAGECVDIDIVTLAELEGRGVVENSEETNRPNWIGPGRSEEQEGWIGPGDEVESSDDADAPDADSEEQDS